MRRLAVVLLGVLLVAGCAREAEPSVPSVATPGAAGPTPASPKPSPPASTSPTPASPSPPPSSPAPTPPTPEPRNATSTGIEAFNGTFDWSGGAAISPGQADTFEVAPGHAWLVANVTFERTEGVLPIDTTTATVELCAPAAVTCPQGSSSGNSNVRFEAPAEAGTWTFRYSGYAAVRATIVATLYVERPPDEEAPENV